GASVDGFVTEPLAGDFLVIAAFDTPRTIVWATPRHAKQLAKTAAELLAIAKKNTIARLGALAPQIKAVGPGTAGYIARGDAYEASRLLQHDEWAPYAKEKWILVSVPATDLVLYCVECPAFVLKAMTEKANKESKTPLSTAVLRWTPTGWAPAL